MPTPVIITFIIPLVIITFIIGNYTLYERTLTKVPVWEAYLVVTIVFLVQEYVITAFSFQAVNYCFYQFVIAVLVYNLLTSNRYGIYMGFLTPLMVNAVENLFIGKTWVWHWEVIIIGWALFAAVVYLGSFAPRGDTRSLLVQLLVLTIGGPLIIAGLDRTGWFHDLPAVPINYGGELPVGVGLILVIYHYFLRAELFDIRAYKQAHHDSLYDELTGLSNYRSLVDYTKQVNSRTGQLAVAVIDMDHFKSVNDRFGHATGNRALKDLAAFLLASCGEDDLVHARVFRYGGEEFCIVFSDLAPESFATVVSHVRSNQQRFSRRPFYSNAGERLPLSFSAGMTIWEPGESIEAVFERADQALYSAKHHGRGQVRIAPGPSAVARRKKEQA